MKNEEQHIKFMQMAIDLSAKSVEEGGGPFGAVIVNKEGEIIAAAHNCVTLNNDPTAHAEVMAIREACQKLQTFDLSGCTLYASCEPCPMCLSSMYWAHIEKYYYAGTQHDAAEIGFDDKFIYDEIALKPKDRFMSRKQILRDATLKVFNTWKNKADKIEY